MHCTASEECVREIMFNNRFFPTLPIPQTREIAPARGADAERLQCWLPPPAKAASRPTCRRTPLSSSVRSRAAAGFRGSVIAHFQAPERAPCGHLLVFHGQFLQRVADSEQLVVNLAESSKAFTASAIITSFHKCPATTGLPELSNALFRIRFDACNWQPDGKNGTFPQFAFDRQVAAHHLAELLADR